MEFGLFNLLSRRAESQTVTSIVEEAAETVKLADQAGFTTAWFPEHHYSIAPSPLMVCAYCAPITQRIKLGTAIVIGTLYQPARLLSEVAFVDGMTNGRLVLGFGSGYQAHEFKRFNIELENSPEITEEMLDIIEGGLTQEAFEYHGKHFDFPHTYMALRPAQNPMPEIWIAGNNAKMQQRAARSGYPLIISALVKDIDFVASLREMAEKNWHEAGEDPANMRLGTLRFAYVTDSREDALEFGDNALFQYRLARNLRFRKEELEKGLLPEIPFEDEPSLEELVENNPIGDPETVAQRIVEEVRRVNAFHMALYMHVGYFPLEKSLRSIERFATEVIPLVEKELGEPVTTAAAAE